MRNNFAAVQLSWGGRVRQRGGRGGAEAVIKTLIIMIMIIIDMNTIINLIIILTLIIMILD